MNPVATSADIGTKDIVQYYLRIFNRVASPNNGEIWQIMYLTDPNPNQNHQGKDI